MRASARIAALVATFDEQDAGLHTSDPLAFTGYAEQLEQARADTGLDEACVWGWADIGGVRCALVVFDFAFMGGSMGIVAGEKVARAFDAARRARTPVVTITASGGARMQEGMWSLVQMAKTVQARRRHGDAGLAHITLLTTPTTGGVYASFATLADIVIAESDATIGFAGPRVVQQLTGDAPPPDVHTAAYALDHGLIDAVVDPDDSAAAVTLALKALAGESKSRRRTERVPDGAESDLDPWDRLQLVRSDDRPKGGAVLDALVSDAVDLRGDRSGEPDDPHVVVRVGHIAGRRVMAIAQNASDDGRIRPAGFRKATRAIELAGRLGVPVVSVIDTRGADPLPSSEAGGVAAAIARTFDALLACRAPTLAVITGEGGSGGALAMAVCDRVIALSNAVFSVIAPEGAAAILYRDASRAPDLARRMRIGAADLVELGMVDVVIPESPPGVENGQVSMDILLSAITSELDALGETRRSRRLAGRRRRWRRIAEPSPGRRRGR